MIYSIQDAARSRDVLRRMHRAPPRSGDVVGFSQCGLWGAVIRLGTCGVPCRSLSHVGIISGANKHGEPLLWESTGCIDEPCEVSGVKTFGLQAHSIYARVPRYRGRVWLFPLRRRTSALARIKLGDFLLEHLGRTYDPLGAFQARHTPLARIRHRLRWTEDLTSLFCSELVMAAWRVMGIVPESVNPSEYSPRRWDRYRKRHRLAGCVRWK